MACYNPGGWTASSAVTILAASPTFGLGSHKETERFKKPKQLTDRAFCITTEELANDQIARQNALRLEDFRVRHLYSPYFGSGENSIKLSFVRLAAPR